MTKTCYHREGDIKVKVGIVISDFEKDQHISLSNQEIQSMLSSTVISDILRLMHNNGHVALLAKYAMPNRHPRYDRRDPLLGRYLHDVNSPVDNYGIERVIPFSDGCCLHLSSNIAVHFGFSADPEKQYVGLSQNRMSRQDYLITLEPDEFEEKLWGMARKLWDDIIEC